MEITHENNLGLQHSVWVCEPWAIQAPKSAFSAGKSIFSRKIKKWRMSRIKVTSRILKI